jgi:hypothetical protein
MRRLWSALARALRSYLADVFAPTTDDEHWDGIV